MAGCCVYEVHSAYEPLSFLDRAHKTAALSIHTARLKGSVEVRLPVLIFGVVTTRGP